jgi:hypothetical protein
VSWDDDVTAVEPLRHGRGRRAVRAVNPLIRMSLQASVTGRDSAQRIRHFRDIPELTLIEMDDLDAGCSRLLRSIALC